MQHLEEGTIHAWLDGALPAEESAGVERHVAVCTECASLVAEARGMIAGASRIVSSLDIVPGRDSRVVACDEVIGLALALASIHAVAGRAGCHARDRRVDRIHAAARHRHQDCPDDVVNRHGPCGRRYSSGGSSGSGQR